MPARVYANVTNLVEEALARATDALELADDASLTSRSTAWIEYGYRHWHAEQGREDRIRAYQELAQDEERLQIIQRSTREAVAAGIL